jgi:hypothetical protein
LGFMDKVKAQATVLADKAQTGVQQGQTKIQEMQASKQVDHLLRELGAYVFLSERDRVQPDSEAKVAGIMGELDGLERAGTPVTVTAAPFPAPGAGAVPPGSAPPGAVPQAGAIPESGAAPQAGLPNPPGAAPPAAGSAIPQSGSAIPQSGGGLPGQ